MVTGPLLIVIFIVSLAFLLVTIIKFKLNAFVSLIITSFLTALLVRMPFGDITSAVADGFSGTIGGIGIVTGMGVMLGMLLFESGGINAIADKMIHLFGEKMCIRDRGIIMTCTPGSLRRNQPCRFWLGKKEFDRNPAGLYSKSRRVFYFRR